MGKQGQNEEKVNKNLGSKRGTKIREFFNYFKYRSHNLVWFYPKECLQHKN